MPQKRTIICFSFVDPEHAQESQENANSKHAILVVGDIDACLDEEQCEGNLTGNHQITVEVGILFFTAVCETIEFIAVVTLDALVRREERRRTERGEGHAEGVIHLVRDPGVDRWESHVDC